MLHRVRRLSGAQRVVIVVALGLALAVGWIWWYSGEVAPEGGWFAYAPATGATDTYFVVHRRQLAHLLVPLALIGVWATVSLWLLGLRPADEGGSSAPR